MIDFLIWNNWYNKTKSNYLNENEEYVIESNVDGGKLYPIIESPFFLRHLEKVKEQKNMLTLRDLRYLCMNSKPPNFQVEEKLSTMFFSTNNKVYRRELPFDCFFVNVNLGEGFKGLLIHKSIFNGEESIQIHYRKEDNEGFGFFGEIDFNQYSINLNKFTYMGYGKNGLENIKKHNLSTKEIQEKAKSIIIWVCNFLDSINHPDIEIIEIKNKFDNDAKRIKRGKAPMPSSNITINIKGKLYRYINQENKTVKNPMSYAFWVRGHYIHFWNKQKWNRLYSLENNQLSKQGYQKDFRGIIAKWKFPFIKCRGKSKPLQKNYQLKQKEKTITNIGEGDDNKTTS